MRPASRLAFRSAGKPARLATPIPDQANAVVLGLRTGLARSGSPHAHDPSSATAVFFGSSHVPGNFSGVGNFEFCCKSFESRVAASRSTRRFSAARAAEQGIGIAEQGTSGGAGNALGFILAEWRDGRARGSFRTCRYCAARPSIWCWRDHLAGKSARRATPMPCGSRPSMAAVTRSGARKASEIVIFTLRTLHLSRLAMLSVVAFARR